jgi:prepilin-type N-terminal cleavage/methylation domain-containing protein
MFEMIRVHQHKDSRMRTKRFGNTRGYTMLEIVIVLAVGSVLTAIAVPQVQSSLYRYRLNSAVAMAKWSVQSTRFQALMKGYPYRVAFNATTNAYQIQNLPSGTTYQNVGSAVPLSGWPMTVNQNTTLQFNPSGAVTAPVGGFTFTITYKGSTKTITVSNYGNVSVTP